ncbi:MAG: CPBP family intramembrane metalloprotease [Clostridiales bacterium]|nr:CPBP family intramembrane metalloprotease [Clostridiales bacterium]
MQNFRKSRTQQNSPRVWIQILAPVIGYLFLIWLIRAGLLRFTSAPYETAAALSAACLFPPVLLFYQLKWKKECARTDRAVPGTGREAVLWILAALAMAALSVLCCGIDEGTRSLPVLAVTCLLAPVSEEILYRGQFIGRGSKVLSAPVLILLSALLFAGAHGFDKSLLAAFPAGLLLGWFYLREERITGIAVIHCSANILISAASCILG